MRCIRLSLIVLVGFLFLVSAACMPGQEAAEDEEEEVKALIRIDVDWDWFNENGHDFALDDPEGFEDAGVETPQVTHLGVRLEFPGDRTVFFGSAGKEADSDRTEIILEVPESEDVHLYAAVAQSGSPEESIIFGYGFIEGLSVEKVEKNEGEEQAEELVYDLEFNLEDFQWVRALWKLDGEYRDLIEGGRFDIDREQEHFTVPYYVRTPSQLDEGSLWDVVRARGWGVSWGEKSEGWRQFSIECENPEVGEEYSAEYLIAPYIPSSAFDLPAGRYHILPEASFEVNWD